MEYNFYHKTNESLRSLGEYVHVLEFLDINLVVLSATGGNITSALFISTIGAPVGLRTSFITIFLHQVMDSLNHS